MELNNSSVFTASEVAAILKVSTSCAYRKIKTLNDELTEKGFEITHGRISKKYFCERFCLEFGGAY
ncbi:MAG: helix-turn-helix domain-containing protein [Ruminococcus flavefaciens]|nr:helix-turn-helix domain-containing protein [Ruminococcus flavefaciens]